MTTTKVFCAIFAALAVAIVATVAVFAAWPQYQVSVDTSTTGPRTNTVLAPNSFQRIVAYTPSTISTATITFVSVDDGSIVLQAGTSSGTNVIFSGNQLHGMYSIVVSDVTATTNAPGPILFTILEWDGE